MIHDTECITYAVMQDSRLRPNLLTPKIMTDRNSKKLWHSEKTTNSVWWEGTFWAWKNFKVWCYHTHHVSYEWCQSTVVLCK